MKQTNFQQVQQANLPQMMKRDWVGAWTIMVSPALFWLAVLFTIQKLGASHIDSDILNVIGAVLVMISIILPVISVIWGVKYYLRTPKNTFVDEKLRKYYIALNILLSIIIIGIVIGLINPALFSACGYSNNPACGVQVM